jgi:hypothetical protein
LHCSKRYRANSCSTFSICGLFPTLVMHHNCPSIFCCTGLPFFSLLK